MYCSKCGKEIPDKSEFCPYCGNKINEKTSKKTSKKEKESLKEKIASHKLLFIAIIIFILLIIASITIVLINSGLINYNKSTNTKFKNVNTERSINDKKTEHYLNILANKERFNFIDNTYLKDVTISEVIKTNFESDISKIKYCIFDIDSDGYDEMYTEINFGNLPEPIVIIFNEENEDLYGFEFTYRQVEEMKIDGTCLRYGGIESYEIYKMNFDKNLVIKHEIASREGNYYIVNNEAVTEEKFNDFFNEFENKKNIELTTYDGEFEKNIEKKNNNGVEIGRTYRFEDTYVSDGLTLGNDWSVKIIDEKNAYINFITYSSGGGEASPATYIISGKQLEVITTDNSYIFTILDDGTLKYDFSGDIFK